MKQKLLLIACLFTFKLLIGQTINRVEVHGFMYANTNDIEGVTIYNKSSNRGTITNQNGEFFIEVTENDVIEISALQFEKQTIIITKEVTTYKLLKIYLKDRVNELREVTIGNRLSGDLLKDINHIEGEPPINFYDLGIPGYTGKIATQSERKLNEATTGGGFIPLNPILNAISGRTKQLKNQIKLEEAEALIQSIKSRLGKDFFASNPLDEHLRMEFFYFCADDENFMEKCKNQTDLDILEFLKMKYEVYLKNRSEHIEKN